MLPTVHKGHKASMVTFLLIEKISGFPLYKVQVNFRYMLSLCLPLAQVQVLLVAVILIILNPSLLVCSLPDEIECLPAYPHTTAAQHPHSTPLELGETLAVYLSDEAT